MGEGPSRASLNQLFKIFCNTKATIFEKGEDLPLLKRQEIVATFELICQQRTNRKSRRGNDIPFLNFISGCSLSPYDIGVLTPYAAQVALLRDLLAPEVAAGVEVDSVDGFQVCHEAAPPHAYAVASMEGARVSARFFWL
jgi:hypothetical protein